MIDKVNLFYVKIENAVHRTIFDESNVISVRMLF